MVPVLAVSAHGTALDDYIAAPDASYTFSTPVATSGSGYTTYTVLMTSQTWQDPSEVNHNAWQHYMKICVPNNVTSDKALLTIGSGSHTTVSLGGYELWRWRPVRSWPRSPTCRASRCNSPEKASPGSEDEIIAKTGRMYLDGADADWLALLPMVKSAVRAMDTVQTVAFDKKGVTVNDFVVTGVSKRGWTTWLTAAVDDRVCAIAPCVINVLNMDEQMKYHKKVYEGVTAGIVGGYSEAVHDYVDEGVFDDMDSPRFQSMLGIIDPYEYRDRLTMPKLMINSTGDEFFVPDSCQFFLDNLPGENYVRYQPNEGHGVVSGQTTLKQFYKAVLNGTDLPDFSWTVEPDGAIRMTTEDAPAAVKLWQATNPNSRDFRQGVPGTTWTSSTLAADEPGVYVASVPEPATGYTAFMIEMTYTVGGEAMTFTTEVNVVPGVLLPGDANFDGEVDDLDASIVGSHWQTQSDATWGMGDFNRDGKVNDADAAIMAANWTGSAEGAEPSVPEPGTLVLLAIGGAVVLCRRRRQGRGDEVKTIACDSPRGITSRRHRRSASAVRGYAARRSPGAWESRGRKRCTTSPRRRRCSCRWRAGRRPAQTGTTCLRSGTSPAWRRDRACGRRRARATSSAAWCRDRVASSPAPGPC